LENVFNEKILRDKNGKPYLKSNNYFFNISYCDNICVIAISKKHKLGIDIVNKNDFVNENIYSEANKKNEEYISKNELFAIKESIIKYEGKTLKEINNIDIQKYKNLIKIYFKQYIVVICFG